MKNVRKTPATRKVSMPTKISTNASLSALTFALLLTDLISSNSKSILVKIFQKDDKDEFILIKEEYYDQSGNFEKLKMFSNNQWTTYLPQTLKKIETFNKKGRGINFYSEAEELLKEIGFDSKKIEDIYKPMFQSAFERASEILFWAVFLERFFKLNTAQSVISFCYTLVRSLDYLSGFKALKRDIIRNLGKNWRWQIAWGLASQDEKVRRFLEDKEKLGKAYLDDWKKSCQKQANNRWDERKYYVEGITKASSEMRNRLKDKFNSR